MPGALPRQRIEPPPIERSWTPSVALTASPAHWVTLSWPMRPVQPGAKWIASSSARLPIDAGVIVIVTESRSTGPLQTQSWSVWTIEPVSTTSFGGFLFLPGLFFPGLAGFAGLGSFRTFGSDGCLTSGIAAATWEPPTQSSAASRIEEARRRLIASLESAGRPPPCHPSSQGSTLTGAPRFGARDLPRLGLRERPERRGDLLAARVLLARPEL